MRRDISSLTAKVYDIVIIGGGIFGICAAWDAIQRGLSVALVEQGDFGAGTSANCFKIVHGGLRYLQHGDFRRMRESNRELNALLRIAPHLVTPLPITIPTHGHGLQGRELLRLALYAYNLITFDRNRGIKDPQRRIPSPHVISRQECLSHYPGLPRDGLTGAMIFHDGHMYSPARLALCYVTSAVKAGADVANYLEAIGILQRGSRIYGIQARDVLSGESLEVRGKIVLNAAGPWAEHLLRQQLGLSLTPPLTYSRDACFVVARPLITHSALAVQGRTRDPDAIVSRGHRHLFIVPWREHTLIGVWHVVYSGTPGKFTVTEKELQGFIDEMNAAYPPLGLTVHDVALWHAGLVPFGNNASGAEDLSYGKRSQLIDHAQEHGVDGLLSMIGVRYTTSRGVAEKAIDLALRKLGREGAKSTTAVTRLNGGDIEGFDDFVRTAIETRPSELTPETINALVRNHGTTYSKVLQCIREARGSTTLGSSPVLKAEVVYAVREEMAQKMGDVVFRRTDLGSGGYPGALALRQCAEIMGAELGWTESRQRRELDEVLSVFPPHTLASDPCTESANGQILLSSETVRTGPALSTEPC